MTTLEIKGDWNITKGKLKQKWGKLTDSDLHLPRQTGRTDRPDPKNHRRTREAVEKPSRNLQAAVANKNRNPNAPDEILSFIDRSDVVDSRFLTAVNRPRPEIRPKPSRRNPYETMATACSSTAQRAERCQPAAVHPARARRCQTTVNKIATTSGPARNC